jgi:multiple sugar transport system permease protein
MDTRNPQLAAQTQSARIGRRHHVQTLPYLLVAPATLMLVAIALYPIIYAVRLSFTNANLIYMNDIVFIGLRNYVKALNDEVFQISFSQTLRWVIVVLVGQFAVSLPTALFLNMNFRFRGFVRTAILVPYAIPSAVTAICWVLMFDANLGVVNDLLMRMGVLKGPIAWMSDSSYAFPIIALAMIWAGFPFVAIVLLAALQAIPDELFEAARVDGAGPWQRFCYITLPQLLPTILLVLLLRTIWLSQHVDLIYIMTRGGPGWSNYTIAVYSLIQVAGERELGYASAVAVMLAIVLIAASIVYIRYIERTQEFLR